VLYQHLCRDEGDGMKKLNIVGAGVKKNSANRLIAIGVTSMETGVKKWRCKRLVAWRDGIQATVVKRTHGSMRCQAWRGEAWDGNSVVLVEERRSARLPHARCGAVARLSTACRA